MQSTRFHSSDGTLENNLRFEKYHCLCSGLTRAVDCSSGDTMVRRYTMVVLRGEHDPREMRWSLSVVLQRAVGLVVAGHHMVIPVVAVVRIGAAVVVVVLGRLRRLPLTVLLVLHPSILEPNFHLALGQI